VGAGAPNVNLGPLICRKILELKKLNLKIPYGKVPALGTKLLFIRYSMRAAAILTFDKCLHLRGRLRLTAARRLSACLHVVESASDEYIF